MADANINITSPLCLQVNVEMATRKRSGKKVQHKMHGKNFANLSFSSMTMAWQQETLQHSFATENELRNESSFATKCIAEMKRRTS